MRGVWRGRIKSMCRMIPARGFVGCTSDFLGLLVMLLLMLIMVAPRRALGSMRRSFAVDMMMMEDECD